MNKPEGRKCQINKYGDVLSHKFIPTEEQTLNIEGVAYSLPELAILIKMEREEARREALNEAANWLYRHNFSLHAVDAIRELEEPEPCR